MTSKVSVESVLELNGIGKKFRVEVANPPNKGGAVRFGRGRRRAFRPVTRDFWALRDVSFQVDEGEVVGIVGRNGSGKSTLLKILSQITEPTEGSANIRGEIGALLEVGTGFHPELTGRENVFLNGSVMGMPRSLVADRFAEIVEFAGVEGFLDTPVKRWSSGMTVRLAFAVAAHLEPEILLIDEVLAVGDAAFQRRCLEKMGSIARDGRTVLFVSHHLGLVQSLCPRAILLQGGTVVSDGPVEAVVNRYLASLSEEASDDLLSRTERNGAGEVQLRRVLIGEHAGIDERSVELATPKMLTAGRRAGFVFEVTDGGPGLSCSFTIYDQQGHPVTFFDSQVAGAGDKTGLGPPDRLTCDLPTCLLMPGRYRLNAAIYRFGELQDHLEGAAFFDVIEGTVDGRSLTHEANYGSTMIPHRWLLP